MQTPVLRRVGIGVDFRSRVDGKGSLETVQSAHAVVLALALDRLLAKTCLSFKRLATTISDASHVTYFLLPLTRPLLFAGKMQGIAAERQRGHVSSGSPLQRTLACYQSRKRITPTIRQLAGQHSGSLVTRMEPQTHAWQARRPRGSFSMLCCPDSSWHSAPLDLYRPTCTSVEPIRADTHADIR
jgi:hypothetical protein